jgi:hypothetical protein
MNVKHLIHSLLVFTVPSMTYFNYTGGHHCQWKAVNVDLCRTHNTSARILTCQAPAMTWDLCISYLKKPMILITIWQGRDCTCYRGKQYADCATILIVRHTCHEYFFAEKTKQFQKLNNEQYNTRFCSLGNHISWCSEKKKWSVNLQDTLSTFPGVNTLWSKILSGALQLWTLSVHLCLYRCAWCNNCKFHTFCW